MALRPSLARLGSRMHELLQRVKERIERRGLKRKDAAEQIGVTPTSLERHLAGAYVRSDSLAKYRGWLNDAARKVRSTSRAVPQQSAPEPVLAHNPIPCPPFTRSQPYNVIDLFSGAGGMSLGFDLLTADAFMQPQGPHLSSRRSWPWTSRTRWWPCTMTTICPPLCCKADPRAG